MLTPVFWLIIYIFHKNLSFFFFIDLAMTSEVSSFDFCIYFGGRHIVARDWRGAKDCRVAAPSPRNRREQGA